MSEKPSATTDDTSLSTEGAVPVQLESINRELRTKVEELIELISDHANLLEATDIATLFLDRQLRIKRYTPAATSLFELGPADVGRPLDQVSHLLDRDTLERDAQRVLDELERFEHEVESADGRTLILRMLPYRSVDDRIDGVVVTAMDISARKRAEREMAASEARLRLALQGAQLGLWQRDMETGLLTSDRRAQTIFGVAEVSASSDIRQRIHPDDLATVDAIIGRAIDPIDPHDSYALEYRLTDAEGHERWLLVQGQCRFRGEDPDRQPLELFGVVLDITDRKRFEQELRESEIRYRSLFENATAGVGRLGLDGRVLEVNERYCEITGRTREELLRTSFQAITHPDDVPEVVRNNAALVSGETDEYRMDKRYLRPDGSIVWVRLSVGLLCDASGTPEAFVKVAEDITKRKQAEAALQTLTGELEERVRARTRQVRDLSRELTLAEHRERSRIARVLHDDLQQELYALQFILHSKREGDDDPAYRARTLEEADQALRTAIAISRTLTSELSPPVLEDEGLREALHWLATHMRERYGLLVELYATAADRWPRFATDVQVLLFQVARELLFNVVKHAQTDRAHVRIDRTGDQVLLTVEDEGIGLDAQRVEQNGSGLGITTIRRRLELLGGRLELSAGTRGGTRAVVMVPAAFGNFGEESVG